MSAVGMKFDWARFGQKVRECRKGKGMTTQRVADLTGLSRSYMSEVECGKREVSAPTAWKIATALGLSSATVMWWMRTEEDARKEGAK